MKSVTISRYSHSGSDYIVHLGNGLKFQFTSKRETLAFLAETSRFLTQSLHSVNLIYSDVFTLYRQNWGYFDDPKSNNRAKLLQIDRDCRDALQSVSEQLERIFFIQGTANGNYWVFINLQSAINSLRQVVFAIRELNYKKSNGAAVYQCSDLISRLLSLSHSLDRYGATDAAGIIPLFTPAQLLEMEARNPAKTRKISNQ